MPKLRVLCLHGYRQNALKLRGRIAAFRRAFKSTVDFGELDFTEALVATRSSVVLPLMNEPNR